MCILHETGLYIPPPPFLRSKQTRRQNRLSSLLAGAPSNPPASASAPSHVAFLLFFFAPQRSRPLPFPTVPRLFLPEQQWCKFQVLADVPFSPRPFEEGIHATMRATRFRLPTPWRPVTFCVLF